MSDNELSSLDSASNISSRHSEPSRRRRQGVYWIGTISRSANPDWSPCLPEGITYLRGQLERGEGGFEHYQVFFLLSRKGSLRTVRTIWDPITGHWELTRSSAAEAYVWKEDSRIGEQFEFGRRPINRSSLPDWDRIRSSAIAGQFDDIPSDIFIRHYSNLQRIRSDHQQPVAMVRSCSVLWGPTGVGKSRRAWLEAGDSAYSKDPRTKFWCGYRGQQNVIIDEFRGSIDISHLLRWLDRYPVRVEIKGSSTPLMATNFWITSNIPPRQWYPDLDEATYLALERRLTIEFLE